MPSAIFRPKELPWSAPELPRTLAGLYTWNGQTYLCRPGQASNQDRYRRRNWAELEPTRGTYNWSKFQQEIDAAKAKKQRVWLGLPVYAGASEYGPYVPEYLAKAGPSEWYEDSWYPNFNKPDTFAALADLLTAFDAWLTSTNQYKYVSHIQCLAFGRYGEGYYPWQLYAKHRADRTDHPLLPTEATTRKIIDLYHRLFGSKVRLDMTLRNDFRFGYAMLQKPFWGWSRMALGHPGQMANIAEAVNSALTIDGVRIGPLVAERWQRAAVLLEWIGLAKEHAPLQWKHALGQIKDVHPALVGNGNFIEYSTGPYNFWNGSCADQPTTKWTAENIADMVQIGKQAGYRFVVEELALSGDFTPGSVLRAQGRILNRGLTPAHEPIEARLHLHAVDQPGRVAFALPLGVNFQTLLTAAPVDAGQKLPDDLPPGRYEAHVYLPGIEGVTRPIPLAIEGVNPGGGYPLGAFDITKAAPPPPPDDTDTPPPPVPNAALLALVSRLTAVQGEIDSIVTALQGEAQPRPTTGQD